MQSPKVDRFVRFWEEMRGAREMPRRRDIDVVGIPELLPHLILLEVVGAGADFRFVLVGEHVTSNYGTRVAHRLLSDLAAQNSTVAGFADNFRSCIAARVPIVLFDEFRSATGSPKRVHGAIAPLSEKGDAVDALLCCTVHLRLQGPRWVDSRMP